MKHSFLFPLLFIFGNLQEKRQKKSQKSFSLIFFLFIKNYIFFDSLLTFWYNKENINSQSNYKGGSAMSFIDEKEIAAAMSVKLDFDVLPEKATFKKASVVHLIEGSANASSDWNCPKCFALHSKKFHQELIPEFWKN